jgi:hypothetical protein
MKMKVNESNFITYGLLLGFIGGLLLDIYKSTIFGDVGLGIIFGPMIGIISGTFIGSFLSRRSKNTE